MGIYTLPKSGQANHLWGKNGVRTVIELFIPPQPKNFYTSPKQISGYAPGPGHRENAQRSASFY